MTLEEFLENKNIDAHTIVCYHFPEDNKPRPPKLDGDSEDIDFEEIMNEWRATNGWRSVEDKLPKDGKRVLCFAEKKDDPIQVGYVFKDGKWIFGNYFEWDMGKVVYWMPLPDKPK